MQFIDCSTQLPTLKSTKQLENQLKDVTNESEMFLTMAPLVVQFTSFDNESD